ncbi:MAG: adenylosuccinate synthase [Patescibacteria group bacterium]
MPVTIIAGAQWGDEGKGKIVDHLSADVDIVARYQGGANAGHTVVIGGQTHVLHLIPAGIFHPHVTCVIGNGTVIDPVALMNEIRQLEVLKIKIAGRLFISHNAHLIMPYHKLLDECRENSGGQKIGTTGRGIGPAYIDKFMRVGIRIVDLLDRDLFKKKFRENIAEKNNILAKIYGETELDADKITQEYVEFDKAIDPYITDTSAYLQESLAGGKSVLAEGAQGALLDIDHGTYPFVTSSNPTSGGACTGLGIPPTAITSIVGVVKAYTTRVGNGALPTELEDEFGEKLRDLGGEFGATTGRPRRCGWFDVMPARHSVMVDGFTRIAVTKLDVLDSFEVIQMCVGYEVNGRRLKRFVTDDKTLKSVKPIYESFPGWQTPTTDVRDYEALPKNARNYLAAMAKYTDTQVDMVSVGARRDQTIIRF